MDPFAQAISKIIKEQQAIIGPIALDQAKKVHGLTVNAVDNISVQGEKKAVLGDLVNQYAKLFGKASVEVCKESIEPFADKIPATDIPDILKN